ncbi:MAG: hypothetical protein IJO70_11845 [Lachnospiraceae bacterium]|nr:hypothetical protein [Lachnospiraceae bacterium]
MNKRKILYGIIAILVLVICYVIGQTVVRPNRSTDMYSKGNHYYDYVKKSDELTYEGYQETTDMPGGKTVGLVEDEVYGKWYLLSPDTSITAGIILDHKDRSLSFEYQIHENVAHLSDGIQLSVQIIKEGTDEILYEENLDVDKTRKSFSLKLAQWKDSNVFVKLQAANSSDDETGDWLVIKNGIID